MNQIKSIALLMLACLLLFSFENNTTDTGNSQANENSNKIEEVKIGTQIWSTKNLDVITFRNGDTIPEAKTNEEWKNAGIEGKPTWCYYDNDPENEGKFGKLYNWYAVKDSRGLAPQGWRIPTDAEWTKLFKYLGGIIVAGIKMKSSSDWNNFEGKPCDGTNESGFNAFPSGHRNFDGTFNELGNIFFWWSSSEYKGVGAWSYNLGYECNGVDKGVAEFYYGYSVRCLKD
jgi:uncharacterized protein (TIGR02145 family)